MLALFALAMMVASASAPRPALEQTIATVMREQAIPGMVVGISRAGAVRISAYGTAGATDVLPIASVSKEFVAAATLADVDDGVLALDEPIAAVFPNAKHAGTITIGDLLAQTSGIPSYTNVQELRTASRDDIARWILDRPAAFAPATQFDYSNSNYFLLGLTLERVERRSLANILERRFLRKLSLRSVRETNDAFLFGAADVRADARDLLTWQSALCTGGAISPSSTARMLEPQALPNGSPTGYGYGIEVARLDGKLSYFHTGSIDGSSSLALYQPEGDIAVAILATREAANLLPLAADVVSDAF